MQLTDHLTSSHPTHKFQSAYRAGRSAETALLCIVNDILTASDANQMYILILLDVSAAFDTIDHSILLCRLWRLWSGPCNLVPAIPVKQAAVRFCERHQLHANHD